MNTQVQKDVSYKMTQLMSSLETLGRNILLSNNSKRKEYDFVWRHLSSCKKILDVGCGVGLFLRYAPERILGVDINTHNVDFCKSSGLQAVVGDALNLEFPDNSFDGVHSSHVMHVYYTGSGHDLYKGNVPRLQTGWEDCCNTETRSQLLLAKS